MSAWDQHVIPPPQVDPLATILMAIGDVKDIVADLRDKDVAYLKSRIDAQWAAIGELERSKADRTEMKALEERVQGSITSAFSRVSDDVADVAAVAKTSDDSFESVNIRLGQIEKETAKIVNMEARMEKIEKVINRLNRISWQMAGAATATGVLGFTAGFIIKMFFHSIWLDSIFR